MPSEAQVHWLTSVCAPAAVACEVSTKLPAEISVAQCCLESGWGTKPSGTNNLFGLKANGRGNGTEMVETGEYVDGELKSELLSFETYATITDCFIDHAKLITEAEIYAPAWQAFLAGGTVADLIVGIAVHYAPLTPNYATVVQEIASEPAVVAAIAAART